MMRRSRFLRPRSALLWLLFLVGVWFWTPQLRDILTLSATRGHAASATADAPPERINVQPAMAGDGQLVELSIPVAQPALPAFQKRPLTVDPMVRSIEVAAVPREPSAGNAQRAGATIVLAERIEDPELNAHTRDPLAAPASPTGLVLTSTLIGVERRGAYINNRLYLEGAAIEHEGEWFQLSAVHPQSVLLEKDGELLELTVQESPARTAGARN